jgi:2-methylisocitrate lyase-like PEP mutase family enzyme
MPTQIELAKTFAALHVSHAPIVLFNAWDAGSAQAVASAGAKAIATGSWSVAAAHGYSDGQKLTLELAIANLARIVASVTLPVTIDLESGYGEAPEAIFHAVSQALASGAVGFNLEDQIVGGTGLYTVTDQASRLKAARQAADATNIPAFINARTDIFLKASAATHDAAMVEAALERAHAYAEAGASGFFAPGLVDENLIATLCKACPLPVNIMVANSSAATQRLAGLGVARISYGPNPYRQAMKFLEEAARAAFLMNINA